MKVVVAQHGNDLILMCKCPAQHFQRFGAAIDQVAAKPESPFLQRRPWPIAGLINQIEQTLEAVETALDIAKREDVADGQFKALSAADFFCVAGVGS